MKAKNTDVTVIEDENGKVVMEINNKGHIAISRSPNMTKDFKDYLVEVYSEITGEDPREIRDFLDYKNEENEFCS